MLRPYQQKTIDDLYDWFKSNEGNPCIVLPTGAGKSHVIAALCTDAVKNWPDTRILMLTYQKELIEQNAEKLRQHWKNAPLGIYSASIGKKDIDSITFAGIQSVRKKSAQLGHIDLCIIDECFVSGTKISTPSGQKDIDKVKCGDLVFNQSGVGVVEAISCKPTFEIYTLELDDGRKIECTGNHKFFTNKGWIEAAKLEDKTYIFGIKDMSCLWKSVLSLDKKIGKWKNNFCNARVSMEEAKLLLSIVCKEITSNRIGRSSQKENKHEAEGDKTQTYSQRRERAIAAFASIGSITRFRRWVGSRVVNKNKCRTSERNLPERLQSRYCKSGKDDCNRAGWSISWSNKKKRTRSEKDEIISGARVVSVSSVKLKSPRLVFNLQVSGHPSFFANGLAAHNCHLVGHKDEGSYRTLLGELKDINPAMRVIGLSATPYRLGHGLITDKPAIFDALIEPVSIIELVDDGYLAPLRSKLTKKVLSVEGVHKRGGEYIESELQAAVDTNDNNVEVVDEVIARAEGRKAWLFFCSGVDHAWHIKDILNQRGIPAECVTGMTPKTERERIIKDFRNGRYRALTNANVLTTGFDYPDIDLIAMLRPTMSPGLYVQMAGRGMRLKSHTDHCLVLDFAGVVETHGPITNVKPPSKSQSSGDGEPPVKVCDNCHELVHISIPICPACLTPFPQPEKAPLKLHRDVDIMGTAVSEMEVTGWAWSKHYSRTTKMEMIKVTYYGVFSDTPVTEYLCVKHEGYAGVKGRNILVSIAKHAGVSLSHILPMSDDIDEVCELFNEAKFPSMIEYKIDGKYHRVTNRRFDNET